mmetsp:Transcript_3240/g.5087  ORF Transcript_3240/g.5087 Transcript_3240/m.5087 type:complete len:276 (-) Transcript_3240:33-860(-)|eukprot:CAMPEP_0196809104 /NCGR_PEP_ID=MMETSP1362-20130617/9079_1 /TAXON_ID=163516 /ORGANISM="Leptocylindrus danicus, Strain CCMP1856" /LENGTH=275 /DNA_ID=CAMNT_0042183683 /DNA_START=44 /DNA_END=871 /DNA_ORIENTATION=-
MSDTEKKNIACTHTPLSSILRQHSWLKILLSDYLTLQDAMKMSFVSKDCRIFVTVRCPPNYLAAKVLKRNSSSINNPNATFKWFNLPIHIPSKDVALVRLSGKWKASSDSWQRYNRIRSNVGNYHTSSILSIQKEIIEDNGWKKVVLAEIGPASRNWECFQLEFNPSDEALCNHGKFLRRANCTLSGHVDRVSDKASQDTYGLWVRISVGELLVRDLNMRMLVHESSSYIQPLEELPRGKMRRHQKHRKVRKQKYEKDRKEARNYCAYEKSLFNS